MVIYVVDLADIRIAMMLSKPSKTFLLVIYLFRALSNAYDPPT